MLSRIHLLFTTAVTYLIFAIITYDNTYVILCANVSYKYFEMYYLKKFIEIYYLKSANLHRFIRHLQNFFCQ